MATIFAGIQPAEGMGSALISEPDGIGVDALVAAKGGVEEVVIFNLCFPGSGTKRL
jgi:hypothetical protein